MLCLCVFHKTSHTPTPQFWVRKGRFSMVLGATGSLWGSTGWYLMVQCLCRTGWYLVVLGQFRMVLVMFGAWWWWVRRGQYWVVLGQYSIALYQGSPLIPKLIYILVGPGFRWYHRIFWLACWILFTLSSDENIADLNLLRNVLASNQNRV